MKSELEFKDKEYYTELILQKIKKEIKPSKLILLKK